MEMEKEMTRRRGWSRSGDDGLDIWFIGGLRRRREWNGAEMEIDRSPFRSATAAGNPIWYHAETIHPDSITDIGTWGEAAVKCPLYNMMSMVCGMDTLSRVYRCLQSSPEEAVLSLISKDQDFLHSLTSSGHARGGSCACGGQRGRRRAAPQQLEPALQRAPQRQGRPQ